MTEQQNFADADALSALDAMFRHVYDCPGCERCAMPPMPFYGWTENAAGGRVYDVPPQEWTHYYESGDSILRIDPDGTRTEFVPDPWRTLALDLLHYIEHGTAAYHGDTPKLQSFKQRAAQLTGITNPNGTAG